LNKKVIFCLFYFPQVV